MRLRCSECHGAFPWAGAWPNHCPLCGYHMGLPEGNEVTAPAVRHNRTGHTDRVYRDMEAGSEFRAAVAAERLGVPASEMSALKITDLGPERPVVNDVTRAMAAPSPVPLGIVSDGAQYSGNVQSGPFPNAGINAINRVRGLHHGPQTEAPANETFQPGYRRR